MQKCVNYNDKYKNNYLKVQTIMKKKHELK